MKRLIRVFGFGTGVIPLGIASVLSIFLLVGIQLFHESSYYFLPDLNLGCILLAAVYIAAAILAGLFLATINHNTVRLAAVFVIALLPRIIIIQLFKLQLYPFSDFLWSWDVALGAREGYSYFVHLPFPAYNVWSCFEFCLTQIFPRTYLSVLLTNAAIDSLIAVCISKLMIILTNDNKSSAIAGVFYALFPTSILYCTIGTPEFITILLNLIGIIYLIKANKIEKSSRYRYLCIAGILFGLSSSFKSFSIVIITAFFVTELFHYRDKVELLSLLIELVLLLFVFFAVKNLILFGVSQWLGIDLSQYSSGVLFHQLLVGLNTEGEGQIHLGTFSRGFWNAFLENGYSSAAAGEHAKRLLIENWKTHKTDIPLLLEQKIVWAWQDDLIPIHYFLNLMGVDGTIHHRIYEVIKNVVPTIAQVMYAAMCVFSVIALVDDFRKDDMNKEWLFIKLIIFGYFVLLLIIEAQSRYKCLIIPLVCIMASRNVKKCSDYASKAWIHKREFKT